MNTTIEPEYGWAVGYTIVQIEHGRVAVRGSHSYTPERAREVAEAMLEAAEQAEATG